MSKPIHTPGPLTVEKPRPLEYGKDPHAISLGGPNGERIAVIAKSALVPLRDREANACLLAAAYNAFDSAAKKLGVNAVELAERMADGGISELVTALGELVSACTDQNLNAYGEPMARALDTHGAAQRKALEAARNALAKVKGEAP